MATAVHDLHPVCCRNVSDTRYLAVDDQHTLPFDDPAALDIDDRHVG